MLSILDKTKLFFEKMDGARDRALCMFIKPYWPRKITPNQLTVARIIIGIYLFVVLFYNKDASRALIISLFCVGAITDLLDGSVARAFYQETKVGAMLDSLADRILIIPIAIYALFYPHRWLFLIIILLEIVNAIVSVYGHGKDVFIPTNIFGKIKMVLQSVVFAAILVFWPAPPNEFFVGILWLSVAFIVVSILYKLFELQSYAASHKNI